MRKNNSLHTFTTSYIQKNESLLPENGKFLHTAKTGTDSIDRRNWES